MIIRVMLKSMPPLEVEGNPDEFAILLYNLMSKFRVIVPISASDPEPKPRRCRMPFGVPAQFANNALIKHGPLTVSEMIDKIRQDENYPIVDSTIRRAIKKLLKEGKILRQNDGKYKALSEYTASESKTRERWTQRNWDDLIECRKNKKLVHEIAQIMGKSKHTIRNKLGELHARKKAEENK